jgi:hypothetical protein
LTSPFVPIEDSWRDIRKRMAWAGPALTIAIVKSRPQHRITRGKSIERELDLLDTGDTRRLEWGKPVSREEEGRKSIKEDIGG